MQSRMECTQDTKDGKSKQKAFLDLSLRNKTEKLTIKIFMILTKEKGTNTKYTTSLQRKDRRVKRLAR